MLVAMDGVVDAVHVGGDDERAQRPVGGRGQGEVGVVEHRHAVQDDLEGQDSPGRGAKGVDRADLDQHGEQDLHRVEPDGGSHVEIAVGMVDPVQPPEGWHLVHDHVLRPDQGVEDQDREEEFEPYGQGGGVEQPPTFRLRIEGRADGQQRQGDGQQPQGEAVEDDDGPVREPAGGAGLRAGTPGPFRLDQGQQGEEADEDGEADEGFVLHEGNLGPWRSRVNWRGM